ncbi:unnamed protein product [Mytilus edulis]|uniref:Uncharacterized protein n=1 Tax=Mytilus edulis TaxID=6550 RepID=A0A8S3UBJ7_MYTED|nr:unnamed protein product [Mytilus edulis]
MVLTLPNATYDRSLICSKKPGKVGAISETGSADFSRELVYGPIQYGYGTASPYQLIKFYGNNLPTTTSLTAPSTASPTTSSTTSSTIPFLKIGLEIAIGITSVIAIVALISVIKSRLNKREQRPNPTPQRNHLSYDQDHMFQNPGIYQISVSNPGYSNPIGDRVDTSYDCALPSYEEAVGNTYEQVNYGASKVSNVYK